MITEQAIVSARHDDRVEVRLLRGSACGHCQLQAGCGTGAVGRLLGRRGRPLTIKCDRPLAPGDRVLVGLPESALVGASLTVYGLPLLGLLAGGLAAAATGLSDGWAAAGSLAGFVSGLLAARRRARRLEENGLAPHIVDIQVNPGTLPGS